MLGKLYRKNQKIESAPPLQRLYILVMKIGYNGEIFTKGKMMDKEILDEFKKEHNIMKRFIYTNELWNRFLNYDVFIDHLRNDSIIKEVIKKC